MSDALRLYRLRTKAMKEALEIDADVESDSEVHNGLSAFDEWENQIIMLSDDSDDDDEDVDLLFDDAEAEASIFARGKIIIEAKKKFLKWKAIGDASNRRGFSNSRTSYYRALQKNENLKSKAIGSKDIRDFFIEEEDTNDEMAHPLVDRQSNKRGMEEALEIAFSLAKVTRNKKQEAKSGMMAWEKTEEEATAQEQGTVNHDFWIHVRLPRIHER